ncbi:MAG: hypothetical protein Q4D82_04435 [Neisseria sp.]|nr:hypothetical protein [Neisseria sp.]
MKTHGKHPLQNAKNAQQNNRIFPKSVQTQIFYAKQILQNKRFCLFFSRLTNFYKVKSMIYSHRNIQRRLKTERSGVSAKLKRSKTELLHSKTKPKPSQASSKSRRGKPRKSAIIGQLFLSERNE